MMNILYLMLAEIYTSPSLMTDRKVPKIIAIIPLFFSIIVGFIIVRFYQVWVDIGMTISGILGLILIYYRNSKEFTD